MLGAARLVEQLIVPPCRASVCPMSFYLTIAGMCNSLSSGTSPCPRTTAHPTNMHSPLFRSLSSLKDEHSHSGACPTPSHHQPEKARCQCARKRRPLGPAQWHSRCPRAPPYRSEGQAVSGNDPGRLRAQTEAQNVWFRTEFMTMFVKIMFEQRFTIRGMGNAVSNKSS